MPKPQQKISVENTPIQHLTQVNPDDTHAAPPDKPWIESFLELIDRDKETMTFLDSSILFSSEEDDEGKSKSTKILLTDLKEKTRVNLEIVEKLKDCLTKRIALKNKIQQELQTTKHLKLKLKYIKNEIHLTLCYKRIYYRLIDEQVTQNDTLLELNVSLAEKAAPSQTEEERNPRLFELKSLQDGNDFIFKALLLKQQKLKKALKEERELDMFLAHFTSTEKNLNRSALLQLKFASDSMQRRMLFAQDKRGNCVLDYAIENREVESIGILLNRIQALLLQNGLDSQILLVEFCHDYLRSTLANLQDETIIDLILSPIENIDNLFFILMSKKEGDDFSCLDWMIHLGYKKLLTKLLEKEKILQAIRENKRGELDALFHLASQLDDQNIFDTLLDLLNKGDKTITLNALNYYLKHLQSNKSYAFIKNVVLANFDENHLKELLFLNIENKNTVFHLAAESNNIALFKQVLVGTRDPALITSLLTLKNKDGFTPLDWAVFNKKDQFALEIFKEMGRRKLLPPHQALSMPEGLSEEQLITYFNSLFSLFHNYSPFKQALFEYAIDTKKEVIFQTLLEKYSIQMGLTTSTHIITTQGGNDFLYRKYLLLAIHHHDLFLINHILNWLKQHASEEALGTVFTPTQYKSAADCVVHLPLQCSPFSLAINCNHTHTLQCIYDFLSGYPILFNKVLQLQSVDERYTFLHEFSLFSKQTISPGFKLLAESLLDEVNEKAPELFQTLLSLKDHEGLTPLELALKKLTQSNSNTFTPSPILTNQRASLFKEIVDPFLDRLLSDYSALSNNYVLPTSEKKGKINKIVDETTHFLYALEKPAETEPAQRNHGNSTLNNLPQTSPAHHRATLKSLLVGKNNENKKSLKHLVAQLIKEPWIEKEKINLLIRSLLLVYLRAYQDKVAKHTKEMGQIDYQHGFRLFSNSRGRSREVNYQLTANLIEKLEKNESFENVFSSQSISKNRANIQQKLNYHGFWNKSGIYSTELNRIIDLGVKFRKQ
ncbi:MAG: hypothetical protein HY939_00590 [Gammaproteobacteria bacterium]|nr:hypothetical protein [Gammaproteobacteria bacterium]